MAPPIPAIPPEKRAAVERDLAALGRKPTTDEAVIIGKRHGCGRTTVLRFWERLHAAQPQPQTPEPTKGNTTLKESVSPVLGKSPTPPPVPKATQPDEVFQCSSCGTEWTLDPGEAQVNRCPGCQEPFQ